MTLAASGLLLLASVASPAQTVPVQELPVQQSDASATQPASPPPSSPTTQPDAQTGSSTAEEGDVVVVGSRVGSTPGDPLEATNLKVFKITQSVDRGFVEPVAMGYKRALPSPVRSGLRHILRNLDEPVNFLHFMLQLKPGRAMKTVGRFTINSTVGIGGIMDVAARKPINLPYRDNGLANTLGYYGIKPGIYFYLPLVGPTTVRDLAGLIGDTVTLPLSIGTPFNKLAYSAPTATLRALDNRVEFDDVLRKLRRDNPHPYTASRDFYLAQRQAEIDALHSKKWRDAHPRKPITY